jgi:hypothetical protein
MIGMQESEIYVCVFERECGKSIDELFRCANFITLAMCEYIERERELARAHDTYANGWMADGGGSVREMRFVMEIMIFDTVAL